MTQGRVTKEGFAKPRDEAAIAEEELRDVRMVANNHYIIIKILLTKIIATLLDISGEIRVTDGHNRIV